MMNFTENEKQTLTKNVKAVLDFVRAEVCPYIRDRQVLKFEDDPTHYPIMFIVNPGKKGAIEFTRGFNSTEYCLGGDYDDMSVKYDLKEHPGHRHSFWECFDEMFAFIQNWRLLKSKLMEVVAHDKNISNTLNSFAV